MLKFREYHTLNILKLYESKNQPLDSLIRAYLKTHKAIGSKDRNQICKNIYYIIRNLSLIDAHLKNPPNWESRLDFILNPEKYELVENLPLHIQTSHPKWLFDLLKNQYDPDTLEKILTSNNTEAPLTIRANLSKVSVDELESQLKLQFPIKRCLLSPIGLKFFRREPVTSLDSYKKGLFEIQDEASQLCCELLTVLPGQHILDYCAGAGGKSLAIAPKLKNKGVIYLHDIRQSAINEAKKRFERSGIHNIQFFHPKSPIPAKLKKKMDIVLTDVPCTGTGTFRRNPDLKWKTSLDDLNNLIPIQQKIFEEALGYLKPGGLIVYSTCSILAEENQNQVSKFLKSYSELKIINEMRLLPQIDGHDGFYACVLKLDVKH